MLTHIKERVDDLRKRRRDAFFRIEMFKRISPEKLAEIEKYMVERTYKKKESLFRQDDRADYIWMVKEGFIKEVHHSSKGRDSILSVVGAGGLFGISSLSSEKYDSQGLAGNQPATVYSIPVILFKKILGSCPETTLLVIYQMAKLLRLSKLAQTYSQEKAESRVVQSLLGLSGELGKIIPMTRREISEVASVSPETCIRVIGRLERSGLVTSAPGKIVLMNMDGLRARLGEFSEPEFSRLPG